MFNISGNFKIKEDTLKLSLLLISISAVFVYLFCSIYKTTIIEHPAYLKERKEQNESLTQVSKRATIYATRKDGELIPLAQDKLMYKLILQPKNIENGLEDFYFEKLSSITEIDKEPFYKKMNMRNDPYEEVKLITEEEAVKINNLYLEGVITLKTFKREYPFEKVGARIVGFVGGGEEGYVGRYGLEKQYESMLKGESQNGASFFSRLLNDIENGNISDETGVSKNLVTSIEPNVLVYLHNHLLEMKSTWDADIVSGIIIKPTSGEILAMDTVPSYDPNSYKDFDVSLFGNPNIQGVYELGSIMKPITMAGGIEEGLVTPESTYKDVGYVEIDNYTIKNFDGKVRGVMTMQEVINQSLNTGAVYVEELLGKEKFRENFDKFGFESITEVDFPGESFNITENLDNGSKVDYATASFGQGVAITPITMLRALSILVNNGVNVYPRFVRAYEDQNGVLDYLNFDRGEDKQVVSSTTAKTVENMMITLIDEGLAQGRYMDKYYNVGAKTGTAQLPSPDGKYYKDKFVHSYFTFVGSGENKMAVLIFQVNPKQGQLASMTLAPSANKLKDFLISYYNLPPDR